MRKEVSYLIIAVIIALGIVVLYYWGGGPTGYTILPEDITNEIDCIGANYTWEESEECILETINSSEVGFINSLGYNLIAPGNASNFSVIEAYNITNSSLPILIPAENYFVDSEIGIVTNATLAIYSDVNFTYSYKIETCEAVGQCIGCDPEHLNLCENQETCEAEEVGGYWYNETCNAEEEPSCSNDLSLCEDEESCTDSGGYWYDDICNTEEEEEGEVGEEEEETEEPAAPPISFTSSAILPLYLNPGNSQESSVTIKNTGETALSSCILKLMGGELDSWISVSEEIININPNQEQAFSFSVTVPEGTAEDSYSLKIATQCLNMYQAHNFVVNVVKKKLEFGLISADRIRDDMVRVIYSLEELSGEDQDVEIGFSLLNENDEEVATASENQSIGANALQEFSTEIEINESLLPINETTNETMESSELTLVADFNSQIYSSSVMEKITLGAAPIGGFAIFAGVGAGEAIIFVVVLLVLVFIFVFARRMRKKGKTLKDIFKKAPKEGLQ